MSTLSISANIDRDAISKNAAAAFAGVTYPVSVTLKNQTPRTLILPEVKIRLNPGASEEVEFPDVGRMRRVVSSLAQIAHLTNATPLVDISAKVNNSPRQGTKPATPTTGFVAAAEPEKVRIIHDDGERFLVELNGVQFEPARNQVREDGTLTPGGRKAFSDAQAKRG